MPIARRSTDNALQIRDELANPALSRAIRAVTRRLPGLSGTPIRLQRASGLRDRRGPVHAGSFLRERRIVFDCTQAEFPRILVHELFHFVWLRLGNPRAAFLGNAVGRGVAPGAPRRTGLVRTMAKRVAERRGY